MDFGEKDNKLYFSGLQVANADKFFKYNEYTGYKNFGLFPNVSDEEKNEISTFLNKKRDRNVKYDENLGKTWQFKQSGTESKKTSRTVWLSVSQYLSESSRKIQFVC